MVYYIQHGLLYFGHRTMKHQIHVSTNYIIPSSIFLFQDGNNFNVGNPLAKDFLSKIEDGTLSTSGGYNAKLPIECNKMLAFWRNGRKRIS